MGVLLGLGSMERISRLEQCEEMFLGVTRVDPEACCFVNIHEFRQYQAGRLVCSVLELRVSLESMFASSGLIVLRLCASCNYPTGIL